MKFDVESIGDDLGAYVPNDAEVTIYLATIYHDFKKTHGILENSLIYRVVDTIIHEDIHEEIDKCIEGKPEDIDDHKVFKYLSDI